MAKIIEKQFEIDISGIVSNAVNTFLQERRKIYAKQEADFVNKVLSEGISYEQQVAWYQGFVNRLKSENIVDDEYLAEVENRFAIAKKNLRYERINEKIRMSIDEYNQRKITIDEYIQRLENQKLGIQDPEILSKMNDALSDIRKNKIDMEEQAFQDRIKWQNQLGNIKVLQDNLSELQSRKAQLIGTSADPIIDELYDSLIAQTQQSLVNRKIAYKEIDLNSKISTTDNPAEIINMYNSFISDADLDIPVIVGNVIYNNETEYWQKSKEVFLTNPESGFIPMMEQSYANKLNKLNATGLLSQGDINSINSDIQSLINNPEFLPIKSKLESSRATFIQKAAGQLANKILTQYDLDYDYQKAMSALESLETSLGVDLLSNKNQLIQTEASALAPQIAEVAQQKGISFEEARKEVKSTPPEVTPLKIVEPIKEKEPATESQVTPPKISSIQHTVSKGETLWDIAKKYGYNPTSEQQVMDLARQWGYIGEATKLPIGQKLTIPKI